MQNIWYVDRKCFLCGSSVRTDLCVLREKNLLPVLFPFRLDKGGELVYSLVPLLALSFFFSFAVRLRLSSSFGFVFPSPTRDKYHKSQFSRLVFLSSGTRLVGESGCG